jgi:oligopeptide transport system substrate-binding protein
LRSSSPLLTYDPKAAQQEWKLGLEELELSTPPSLTLSYNTGEDHGRLAHALQSQWHKTLGVEISLCPSEFQLHLQNLAEGRYEIARYGWYARLSDGVDLLLFLQAFQPLTLDPTQRLTSLQKAEEELLAKMPLIPLFFVSYAYLVSPHLQGVVLTQTGKLDFRWAHWVPQ